MVLKHQNALIAEDNDDIAIQGVACNLPQVIQDLLGRCHVLFRIIYDWQGLVINKDEAFVRLREVLITSNLDVELSDLGSLDHGPGISTLSCELLLSQIIHGARTVSYL